MLSKFGRLYRKYTACHTKYQFPAFPLLNSENDCVGYVEEYVVTQSTCRLCGWTLANKVMLSAGDNCYPITRRIQRGDVLVALNSRMPSSDNTLGLVGFDISVPWTAPVHLIAEDVPDVGPWFLPVPTDLMIYAERLRVAGAFVRDLLSAAPAGLRYFLGGRKRADRERVRALMGFKDEPKASLALSPQFFTVAATPEGSFSSTTIIMPIYNAFELLGEALERVVRYTDVPWHLVLIEDASSDERVRPWLSEWASERRDRVTLLLNDQNLGFIGSVNRGLAVAVQRGGPAILLNSDALVPEGWASRLLQPILENEHVASVTPMSNDATILTVPWISGRVELPPGAADEIDKAARRLSSQSRARIPTGVGFCMAMSRAALDAVPTLDAAFGRGYGEEVDWCRKTAKEGMIHLGIGNLFVEHRGGASFGSVEKLKALESSARIIRARYPEFDEEAVSYTHLTLPTNREV